MRDAAKLAIMETYGHEGEKGRVDFTREEILLDQKNNIYQMG